jgi:hypothetical protein
LALTATEIKEVPPTEHCCGRIVRQGVAERLVWPLFIVDPYRGTQRRESDLRVLARLVRRQIVVLG